MPDLKEKFCPTPDDRPASTFLPFVRQRFRNKMELTGDPVPWHLDDKLNAYAFAHEHGFRAPEHQRFSTLTEALYAALTLDAFVIKQPGWHSCIGVHVLKRLPEEHATRGSAEEGFLDLLTLRIVKARDIQPVEVEGAPVPYWILEHVIPSNVAGRMVPLDYKIYCFDGEPGMVLQIDRNVAPARMAIFDGLFLPLEYETHFTLDENRALPGNHVLPRYPAQLLHMARELARATATRYVSVDAYDGPDGPLLGEFTFAPGGPAHGMMDFSPEVLAQLDAWITGAPVSTLSGLDLDLAAFRQACAIERQPLVASATHHALLAAAACAGDKRYGKAFASVPASGRLGQHWALAARLIGMLNGDAERALQIYRNLQKRQGFVTGPSRADDFEQAAYAYHSQRAESSAGHARLAQQLRAERQQRSAGGASPGDPGDA